jgi:hypothetical protein
VGIPDLARKRFDSVAEPLLCIYQSTPDGPGRNAKYAADFANREAETSAENRYEPFFAQAMKPTLVAVSHANLRQQSALQEIEPAPLLEDVKKSKFTLKRISVKNFSGFNDYYS